MIIRINSGWRFSGQEICISSDGLESFVSAFGASKNNEARKILEENKAERHIRGGEATRLKYMGTHYL